MSGTYLQVKSLSLRCASLVTSHSWPRKAGRFVIFGEKTCACHRQRGRYLPFGSELSSSRVRSGRGCTNTPYLLPALHTLNSSTETLHQGGGGGTYHCPLFLGLDKQYNFKMGTIESAPPVRNKGVHIPGVATICHTSAPYTKHTYISCVVRDDYY